MSTATEVRLDKFIEADGPIEVWKSVWRKGFAPILSLPQLEALKRGLESNDPTLIQGATTNPPPLDCMGDWAVKSACAVAFCGWEKDKSTVNDLSVFFGRACYEADRLLGEPAACRWFFNYFDESPREVAFRDLLAEVNREIKLRESLASESDGRGRSPALCMVDSGRAIMGDVA